MKILSLLLLVVVIVTVAARKGGKKDKKGRKRNKVICGSNGVKYDSACEFYTAVKETCESEIFLNKAPLKRCATNQVANPKKEKKAEKKMKKLQKKLQNEICANDGKTYKQCAFMAEKHCRKLKIVHFGKCGECTEENICQRFEKNFAKMKKKGKQSRKIRKRSEKLKNRKICAKDGQEYFGKCQFMLAKCNLFVEKNEVLQRKKCE